MSAPDPRALIREALSAQQSGDIERAKGALQRAIDSDANSVDARVLMARLRAAIFEILDVRLAASARGRETR